VNCVRIDLQDPDVQLMTTPRSPSYAPPNNETLSLSASNFLKQQGLKVATVANFYSPGDPTFEGSPLTVYGLLMSTGVVVSAAEAPDGRISDSNNRFVSMLFTTNKQVSLLLSNAAPGTNTTGIFTAVSGYYPVATNGVILGTALLSSLYPDSSIHGAEPRTVHGLSADRRYLYFMIIDGRQTGYSQGADDTEMGIWAVTFGMADAVNMDGGGSASMYMADCVGNPLPLGHSSLVQARNRERFTGAQIGVLAQPLPTFITAISAVPGSTSATVTWQTQTNGTSQVEYGTTPALGSFSAYDPTLLTSHSVTLNGLAAGTKYYYRVLSVVGVVP
jgi:hypothetical protein